VELKEQSLGALQTTVKLPPFNINIYFDLLVKPISSHTPSTQALSPLHDAPPWRAAHRSQARYKPSVASHPGATSQGSPLRDGPCAYNIEEIPLSSLLRSGPNDDSTRSCSSALFPNHFSHIQKACLNSERIAMVAMAVKKSRQEWAGWWGGWM
jgi:hypothetical protein